MFGSLQLQKRDVKLSKLLFCTWNLILTSRTKMKWAWKVCVGGGGEKRNRRETEISLLPAKPWVLKFIFGIFWHFLINTIEVVKVREKQDPCPGRQIWIFLLSSITHLFSSYQMAEQTGGLEVKGSHHRQNTHSQPLGHWITNHYVHPWLKWWSVY